MKNEKTKRLTLSAIMIALGTILSLIKIFHLPTGGAITLFSMLPVMVASYTYGVPWGLLTGSVFGVLQAVLGATASQAFAGQKLLGVLGILFMDYIAAFAALGLAGTFKGRIKTPAVSFAVGIVFAGCVRYLCHLLSGYLLFGSYAEWFFTEVLVNDTTAKILGMAAEHPQLVALIYSAIYNALYLVPEVIITCIAGTILVLTVPPVRKEMTRQHNT